MIQQLRNTRSDKQLKLNDMARISYASCLNFFHTSSMFSPWPLGIFYSLDIYYVKRLDSSTYLHQQCWATTEAGTSPSNMFKGRTGTWQITTTQATAIHPDLICDKDNDERVLIRCRYRKMNFTKSKLGFFLIEPKAETLYNQANFIEYKLVITPKPDLFPIDE